MVAHTSCRSSATSATIFVALSLVLALYTYVGALICIAPCFDGGRLEGLGNALAAVLAVLACLFGSSFAAAMLTDPGIPDARDAERGGDGGGAPRRYCDPCAAWKPPRCHHCKRCERCVAKMDHHCVWLNNCVGRDNHKYFFLSVVYGELSCVYVVVLCAIRWVAAARGYRPFLPGSGGDVALLALCTVLSAFHAATVGYLLGFHVFLISRGRTHVEHVCCKGEGPGCSFDTGSVPLNWRDAFGPMLIDWWLPTPSLGAARRGAGAGAGGGGGAAAAVAAACCGDRADRRAPHAFRWPLASARAL